MPRTVSRVELMLETERKAFATSLAKQCSNAKRRQLEGHGEGKAEERTCKEEDSETDGKH